MALSRTALKEVKEAIREILGSPEGAELIRQATKELKAAEKAEAAAAKKLAAEQKKAEAEAAKEAKAAKK